MAGHQLLKIVDDLVHSRGLRAQFNDDPEGFMSRYNLTEAARSALYTMDPHEIGAALGSELAGFQFEPGEFAECDVPGSLTQPDLLYPGPQPKTFGIVPESAPATDGLEVSIWGQSFPREISIVFDPPIALGPIRREGKYRCGRLIATLPSPSAGVYEVSVHSSQTGPIGPKWVLTLT